MKLTRYAAATALAVLLLAGCSAGGPATGGTDGGGQSGASDGGSSSTETGTETTDEGLEGFEGMPATFPNDVPVIDGDVLFGVDLGTGWTIVVQADDIALAYTDAQSRLEAAGFAAQITSTEDDGSFGSFTSELYTVQVTSTDSADYGPSVTYVVILNG